MLDSTINDWAPCPAGEFTRLTERLRLRRRRRALLGTVKFTALPMLLVAGWFLLPEEPQYNVAGISCSRVLQLAEAYRTGQLDDALHDQVRRHVIECPHCGPIYEELGLAALAIGSVRGWDSLSIDDNVEVLSSLQNTTMIVATSVLMSR